MDIEKEIEFFKSKEAYTQYFAGNPRLFEFVKELLQEREQNINVPLIFKN